jgi:hypothetical protein
MVTLELVQNRLWLAAELRAAQAGFGIAPDCTLHLRGFVDAGAVTLMAEGHLQDATRVALAEANIIAFTSRMVVEATTLGLTELHEPTFFAAKSALCPIWPFC